MLTQIQQISTYQTLVSRSPIILIGLALWAKFVENSTKLTWLKVTGYRITYSRVLRLIELQISLGRKVQIEVLQPNFKLLM